MPTNTIDTRNEGMASAGKVNRAPSITRANPNAKEMAPTGEATAALPKHSFGVTNQLGGAATLQSRNDASSVNQAANNFVKKIANRVREHLEQLHQERLKAETAELIATGDVNKDLTVTIKANIYKQYRGDVREVVYAEYEPTVGSWQTIVEQTLRSELYEIVKAEMLKKYSQEGTPEFKKIEAEIEQEKESVKARLTAERNSQIWDDLEKGREAKKAELSRKHKARLMRELRREAFSQLKHENRVLVRKGMEKKLKLKLRRLAQLDADTDTSNESTDEDSNMGSDSDTNDESDDEPPTIGQPTRSKQITRFNLQQVSDVHRPPASQPTRRWRAPTPFNPPPQISTSTTHPSARAPSHTTSSPGPSTPTSSAQGFKRKSEELNDEDKIQTYRKKRVRHNSQEDDADSYPASPSVGVPSVPATSAKVQSNKTSRAPASVAQASTRVPSSHHSSSLTESARPSLIVS